MSQEFQDILPCYFLGWVHSYRQRLWTTTPPSLLYGGVGDRPAHFLVGTTGARRRACSCGAGRIERLFYGGSWRVGCWRCSVQLRGRLAALREVAPCLNARRVQALRWQLHPRVQALRLGKLRLTLAFVCSTIKA